MRILLLPNAFKNALTAEEAGQAMVRGIRQIDPEVTIEMIPIPDGGDGTLSALLPHFNAEKRKLQVSGPLGDPVNAFWGLNKTGGIAIIELAEASGLQLISPTKMDPWRASTFGTGQLIREALREGCTTIYLTVGGSATVDGGLGILQALGAVFIDEQGHEVSITHLTDLFKVASISFVKLRQQLVNTKLVVLTDVENVLCGNEGAVQIYGPQKGIRTEDLATFNALLQHWAWLLSTQTALNIWELKGGGASGGVPAGIAACHDHVQIMSGAEWILDLNKISERIQLADWVLTCEGKIDHQTRFGKGPGRIAHLSETLMVPCVALCGQISEDYEAVHSPFTAVFSINRKPQSLEVSIRDSAINLSHMAGQVYQLMALKRTKKSNKNIT